MKKSRKSAEKKNAKDYARPRNATERAVLSPSARADMKAYKEKHGTKAMTDRQEKALKARRKRRLKNSE